MSGQCFKDKSVSPKFLNFLSRIGPLAVALHFVSDYEADLDDCYKIK